jgi:hypothetical protein
LGNQAPAAMAIEKNLKNVLSVYREDITRVWGRRRLQGKLSSIRGRVFCKREGCKSLSSVSSASRNLHPKLSKEEVHDVMKGIYDDIYSGSNRKVLLYRELIRNQVFTQGAGVMETHLKKYSMCTRIFYGTRKSQIREGDQNTLQKNRSMLR